MLGELGRIVQNPGKERIWSRDERERKRESAVTQSFVSPPNHPPNHPPKSHLPNHQSFTRVTYPQEPPLFLDV